MGAEGSPGTGTGRVEAGGGPMSVGGTSGPRFLVRTGDFELYAQCGPNGPSFFVHNLATLPLDILQEFPGQEPTVVPVPGGGTSPATPAKSVPTVTFLSGTRQNPFIFTAWGQKTDLGCDVSATSVSAID
jgi:hypothetical protein